MIFAYANFVCKFVDLVGITSVATSARSAVQNHLKVRIELSLSAIVFGTCGDNARFPNSLWLAMMYLSAKAAVGPCAQHEPQ